MYKGTPVAVKVQRAGLKELFDTDLKNLKARRAPQRRSPAAPHPAPRTLHPAPCTLYPVPCTLYPAPCTLYPVPWGDGASNS